MIEFECDFHNLVNALPVDPRDGLCQTSHLLCLTWLRDVNATRFLLQVKPDFCRILVFRQPEGEQARTVPVQVQSVFAMICPIV